MCGPKTASIVDSLDSPLGLDVDNGSVDVSRYTVTSVQQTTSHVFTLSGVTLDHLGGSLETSVGHLGDGVRLVEGFLSTDDRSVRSKREMDTGETKDIAEATLVIRARYPNDPN
jgi:hypothetical protein